jgi:hypothetical protein
LLVFFFRAIIVAINPKTHRTTIIVAISEVLSDVEFTIVVGEDVRGLTVDVAEGVGAADIIIVGVGYVGDSVRVSVVGGVVGVGVGSGIKLTVTVVVLPAIIVVVFSQS